jgi:hypothetical protein
VPVSLVAGLGLDRGGLFAGGRPFRSIIEATCDDSPIEVWHGPSPGPRPLVRSRIKHLSATVTDTLESVSTQRCWRPMASQAGWQSFAVLIRHLESRAILRPRPAMIVDPHSCDVGMAEPFLHLGCRPGVERIGGGGRAQRMRADLEAQRRKIGPHQFVNPVRGDRRIMAAGAVVADRANSAPFSSVPCWTLPR